MMMSHEAENSFIANAITEISVGGQQLKILEAGCGQTWPIDLADLNYMLTGVDLDADALAIRLTVKKDLGEAIVADLRDLSLLECRKFDVIYNSFVLEHIQNTAKVMQNFDNLLRQGGLLILRIPDRNSVYGFVTRFTPFWFHVAYKKYIQGRKNAGKPGHAPYPTFHEYIVSGNGIREFCNKYDYEIIFENKTDDHIKNKTFKILIVKNISIIISWLSLGKLPWRHCNLTYVLKKRSRTD